MSETMDNFDRAYDYDKYKLSYEIKSSSALSSKQMKRLLESDYFFSDMVDGLLGNYKQFRKADVMIQAKHGGQIKTESITMLLVQESGNWKLFQLERN